MDADAVATEPPITPQARQVLEARYLLRDASGELTETPGGMLWRVAQAVAAVEAEPERWAQAFFRCMARLEFLPNSPTLMNAGREGGQLSACFVLPVEDSLEGIFDSVKNAARIHQTGGGTGFSFSRLRPRGDPLSGRGQASGPVGFMNVFDAATGAVHQGGVRRGANMGILRVDHPDVLEFVDAKRTDGALSHFNLSVAITDAFMAALRADQDYDLINPRTGEPSSRLSAREVWTRLVDAAWQTGDPGLVFLDRINAAHPTPHLGAIESSNPCGEQPLMPYESCNLGSIDVGKHVNADGTDVDWERLDATVDLAVRFLDDVIEANAYPLAEIDEVTRATRKIGLGLMGWADLLIRLGIPYASERALELADRVMTRINARGHAASQALAAERGPFPAWEGSRPQQAGEPPRRNSTVTTIAPTGTIAIIAGCSSGIEPLFALAYTRRALDGQALLRIFDEGVQRVLEARGLWSEELRARIEELGHLADDEGDAELRELLATAHEISPAWHVRMQAAFQRHVDNAVSKTINLPSEAATADVDAAYRLADELGCKGITVYRDGSRAGQVLSVSGPCNGPDCKI